MATNSMVPYSNPAGKNQTSPVSTLSTATPGMAVPTSTPTDPAAAIQANPAIPATATPTVPSTVAAPGTDQPFAQQLNDIYGASGDSLYWFLQNMSGVNSQTLQDYIKSLGPEFAKSDANLRASLGAGGVSANSSVAALGEANLKASEDALVAGESANLLQSQEQLQANLLESVLPDARNEISDSSGWNTFAHIIDGIAGLGGALLDFKKL